MVLLPYDLTFKDPVVVQRSLDSEKQGHRLESKNGFLIKIEKDHIISFTDVSPLPYLNTESYKDVYRDCKNINTNEVFEEIDLYLKRNHVLFREEKFLDYDFSKFTQHPSLKHALSCLFSDYYRQKLGIKIEGRVALHSLATSCHPNALEKILQFEKHGFQKVKIKLGTDVKKDHELLKNVLSKTQSLNLRIDANKKLSLEDYKILLGGLDISRIDFIEDPLKSDLSQEFYQATKVPIALDEDFSFNQDFKFEGIKSAIIKPTAIGDYYTIKRISEKCKKHGISVIFSSSFESQVGIYQIAQIAHALAPQETHGLFTFDDFLESLMDIQMDGRFLVLKGPLRIEGPIYVA